MAKKALITAAAGEIGAAMARGPGRRDTRSRFRTSTAKAASVWPSRPA